MQRGKHIRTPEMLAKMSKALKGKNVKHGLSHSGFYKSWIALRSRCNNKNNIYYCNYGGRGIKCEWQNFEEFRKDMYQSYAEHLKLHPKNTSIERIDNDGNYNKQNCCWATKSEQARNMRNNHLITYNGKTQCIKAWADELGIDPSTLGTRIRKLHWPMDKVLTPIM